MQKMWKARKKVELKTDSRAGSRAAACPAASPQDLSGAGVWVHGGRAPAPLPHQPQHGQPGQ